jgi:hypothetical protein
MRLVLGLFWLVLIALAWDISHFGFANSISAKSFPSLSERVVEAGEAVPVMLESGAQRLRSLMNRSRLALDWINPLPDEPIRSVKDLDAKTIWAMQMASKRTDVSVAYLINTAHLEANFDPSVKSNTSTAAGLFQFIEQTWLSLVFAHGAEYGWGSYVGKILCTGGLCTATCDADLALILELRYDAMTATFFAAEFARKNRHYLQQELGEPVTDTQLYLAHLLGAAGAVRLLKEIKSKPEESAKTLFPSAAGANRPLFFSGDGKALNVKQFYDNVDQRWNAGLQILSPPTLAAGASPAKS